MWVEANQEANDLEELTQPVDRLWNRDILILIDEWFGLEKPG
jgi:hypothetical protein